MMIRRLPPRASPVALGARVLAALAVSAMVLAAVVHVSGTTESVIRGIHPQQLAGAPQAPVVAPPEESPLISKLLDHDDDDDDDDATGEDVHFSIAYNGHRIRSGAYVPMHEAAKPPTIAIADNNDDDANTDAPYTWILVDIDAPDPTAPTHAPFLHYIVANINATGGATPRVVVSYFPVTPPVGKHRYVSLLFRQTTGTLAESALAGYEAQLAEKRGNFDVPAFVKRHGLALAGLEFFYSTPEPTAEP